MTTVSLEKWNELTEEQQKLMRGIGVTPKKPYAPREPKAVVIKEYHLRAKIYCQLCRTVSTEYFFMGHSTGRSSNPFLSGVNEEFDPTKNYKLAIFIRPTCKKCLPALLTWDKEKLANKLIVTWPAYVTSLLTGHSQPKIQQTVNEDGSKKKQQNF